MCSIINNTSPSIILEYVFSIQINKFMNLNIIKNQTTQIFSIKSSKYIYKSIIYKNIGEIGLTNDYLINCYFDLQYSINSISYFNTFICNYFENEKIDNYKFLKKFFSN